MIVVALPPALMKAAVDASKIVLESSAKRVGAGLLALMEAAMRGTDVGSKRGV